MDKIIFIGNLGKDPEMRYTPTGKPVTNFSVAVKAKVFLDGETKDATKWYRVTTWGNQAEACKEYLNKGDKVYVEGQLTFDVETGGPRIWGEDEAKATFEVNAQYVEFLLTKGGGSPATPYDEDEQPKRKPKPAKAKSSGKAPWEQD